MPDLCLTSFGMVAVVVVDVVAWPNSLEVPLRLLDKFRAKTCGCGCCRGMRKSGRFTQFSDS